MGWDFERQCSRGPRARESSPPVTAGAWQEVAGGFLYPRASDEGLCLRLSWLTHSRGPHVRGMATPVERMMRPLHNQVCALLVGLCSRNFSIHMHSFS